MKFNEIQWLTFRVVYIAVCEIDLLTKLKRNLNFKYMLVSKLEKYKQDRITTLETRLISYSQLNYRWCWHWIMTETSSPRSEYDPSGRTDKLFFTIKKNFTFKMMSTNTFRWPGSSNPKSYLGLYSRNNNNSIC